MPGIVESFVIGFKKGYDGARKNQKAKRSTVDYRRKARKAYGSKCLICGYTDWRVLQVHHRDSNRTNNKIENLAVLCPTCHGEVQRGIKKV